MVKGFIPFVNYFVSSGGANPYDYFQSLQLIKAFPYPSVMLWVMSLGRLIIQPFVNSDWTQVTPIHLLGSRLAILAADLVIYLVLVQLLPTKQRSILLYWWCSPIIFYISYYHGQLDIIPTAFLVLAIFLLTCKRYLMSAGVLALGLATKSHLVLALPFYLVYLVKKRLPWPKMAGLTVLLISLYLLALSPYLFSAGFGQLVLRAEEQARFFALSVNFPINLVIHIAFGAYLVLLFRFASYKRITQDALMVFLGLMLTTLVVLVPPSPGWYLWSIPFLTYFFVKFSDAPIYSLMLYNLSFLMFFLFYDRSDIFQAWQVINPSVADWPTPSAYLASRGLPSTIAANGLFTLLQSTLVMNTYWTYRTGIKSHLEKKLDEKPFIIGIAGDSGAGKTRLANLLLDLFGHHNTLVVKGDDVHRWPRGDQRWQIFTHLNPKSNLLHLDADHLANLRQGLTIERSFYDHQVGQFTQPTKVIPNRFVIAEGLHSLYLANTRSLLDLKIFIDPDERLRWQWKVERDQEERGHHPPAIIEQLKRRAGDAQKYITPQRQFSDLIIHYEPLGRQPADRLALEIYCRNSLDTEPIYESLSKTPSLAINHWYEDDLEFQGLRFDGQITSREVKDLVYQLVPNYEELLDYQPRWHAGYDGINQLFVLYYYSKLQERSL